MIKHSYKEIEEAIQYAISQGWAFTKKKKPGHVYGELKCPNANKCCIVRIPSTPRNSGNAKKRIIDEIDKCK